MTARSEIARNNECMSSQANSAKLLINTSMNPVMLPEGAPRRGLVPTELERSEKFLASYERDVLFYDVFWDRDHRKILMIGPPAIDLAAHYRSATYRALPSGRLLQPRGHHSKHVQLFSLQAPPETTHLEVSFAGRVQQIVVASNKAEFFAGQKLLFTLSQNNDLAWIADWARFHVVNQGVTAVLLFDNRSDRYRLNDIESCLLDVPGLSRVGVVGVPFNYPHADEAVPKDIFWAHFLQPAVIVDMYRRFGIAAQGILNCDIDELAVPLANETVFESAARSRSGTVYFRGCWIEAVPETQKPGNYRHTDFRSVASDVNYARGGTNKWALVPNRRWLQRLRSHPYPHAIANRPWGTRHKPGTAFIAHFKAISTGWKYERGVVASSAMDLKKEPKLSEALDRAFEPASKSPQTV